MIIFLYWFWIFKLYFKILNYSLVKTHSIEVTMIKLCVEVIRLSNDQNYFDLPFYLFFSHWVVVNSYDFCSIFCSRFKFLVVWINSFISFVCSIRFDSLGVGVGVGEGVSEYNSLRYFIWKNSTPLLLLASK